jgi:hypothetical protein
MVRRIIATLGCSLAVASLAASAALAATPGEPASANGYHSAFSNLQQELAARRAGTASAQSLTNGVPVNSATNTCGAPGYIQSKWNGLYVSTELGYSGNQYGMLRARATSVGPWELYQFCALESIYYIYANADNRYVSAELGYTGEEYGMLRGRSLGIGPWERYKVTGCCNDMIFQSAANLNYVTGEFAFRGSYYGMLRARARTLGEWQEWINH